MKALTASEMGDKACMKYLATTGNSVMAAAALIPVVRIWAREYFARIPNRQPNINPITWFSAKIPTLSFNISVSNSLLSPGIFLKTRAIGYKIAPKNNVAWVTDTPGIPVSFSIRC